MLTADLTPVAAKEGKPMRRLIVSNKSNQSVDCAGIFSFFSLTESFHLIMASTL